MWRILRSNQGVCFATPDQSVYQDRLMQSNRPADRASMSAAFSMTSAMLTPDEAGQVGKSDVFDYGLLERYADAFVASAEQTGPLKVDHREQTRIRFGRLEIGNFAVERHAAAIMLCLIRSLPDPVGGCFTVVGHSRGGPEVFDPRIVQLWYGLLILVPGSPTNFGVVQVHSPEIPLRLDYRLDGYGDFKPVFPAPSAFDRFTGSNAAVMTTFLDRGVLARE